MSRGEGKKESESNILLRSTAGLARLPDPHVISHRSDALAIGRPGRGIHTEWGSIAPECGSQWERSGGRSRAHHMISKRAGGQKQDETADGKEPFASTKFMHELSPSLWPFHSWNDARTRHRHSASTLLFHPVAYPTSS